LEVCLRSSGAFDTNGIALCFAVSHSEVKQQILDLFATKSPARRIKEQFSSPAAAELRQGIDNQ
jgi:hypothetical protein